MKVLGASMTALLMLAACDQAERAIGSAVGPRKAIAELKYAGDRPDVPPLEERGNAQFTNAAYDDTGTLLITEAWFGSARLQVWNAEDGTLIAGFDGIIPNPGSHNIWMIDSARRRLFARNGKSDGFALFDLMTGKTISAIDDTDDGAGGKVRRHRRPHEPYPVGLVNDNTQAVIFKPGAIELWDVDPPRLAKRVPSPFSEQRFAPVAVGGTPGSAYTDKEQWEWSPDRRTLAVAYTEEPMQGLTQVPADRRGHAGGRTPHASQERATPLAHGFCVLAGPPLARGRRQRGILALRSHHEGVGQAYRRRAAPQQRAGADAVHRRQLAPDRARRSAADVGVQRAFGIRWRAGTSRSSKTGRARSGSPRTAAASCVYKFLSDTFEVLDGSDAKRLGWVCPYFCNVMHAPLDRPFAVSPDGKSVAISNRRGVAVWDTATDTIRFPLKDPKRKPLPYPMQR